MASISGLGINYNDIWENYLGSDTTFSENQYDKFQALASKISAENWEKVNTLKENEHYKSLDPSVLLAIWVARKAFEYTNWKDKNIGINIGSSRGATSLFEQYFQEYTNDKIGRASTLSSPTTTLGNLASWVGHDLQTYGPTISHSIACSTSLHAVLNGIAWINSGMCETFMVGGSEASLTPFTIAQMKALKIYAESRDQYPSKALDFSKKRNTMILGEGAAAFCLERFKGQKVLAIIEGYGYATEPLKHNISISTDADCFQKSMRMALKNIDVSEIDAIVMHAPGTVKGDLSEYNAIQKIFQDKIPLLTSNKWKIGHTLGASGALSMELAIMMLQKQQFIGVPFLKDNRTEKSLKKIMVNAVGFGGNAVSIVLSLD